MASKRLAQFFLLLLVALCGTVVCQPPPEQQDALTAMATAFGVLETSHGWNSSNAESACEWNGVTCGSGSVITRIELCGIALDGALPLQMEDLTDILVLNMSNCGVNGPLPNLSAWSTITHIDVSNNELSGSISTLSGLTTLEVVDLSLNSFSGPLIDVSSFSTLSIFSVRNNQFDLCDSDPHFSGEIICDVRGQSESPSACASYYSLCLSDLAPASPANPFPAAPGTTEPQTTPQSPPSAPLQAPPQASPQAPPTAPESPTPQAPETTPQAPETTPQAPENAPQEPPQAPPAAPETSPSISPTIEPASNPEPTLEESPDAPQATPAVNEPTEVPETAPFNMSEPSTVPFVLPPTADVPIGSILPFGLCLELTSEYTGNFYFSYLSTLTEPVTIYPGENNRLSPEPTASYVYDPSGIPIVFYPGYHSTALTVPVTLLVSTLTWNLNGYAATVSWSLTDFSSACAVVPTFLKLSFAGTLASDSDTATAIKSYISDIPLVNATRLTVTVENTTSAKRAPSFDATVNVSAPQGSEASAINILGVIQNNISSDGGHKMSQVIESSGAASGISFLRSSSTDPFTPKGLPVLSGPPPVAAASQPWNYKTFTGAQKAGVAIAAIFGCSILVAVAVGLWWVSRPSTQGSSALTASNGANSRSRSNYESGNTSKNSLANEEEDSQDGTSDDEDEDDEDDSEVESSEEVSEEESEEESAGEASEEESEQESGDNDEDDENDESSS